MCIVFLKISQAPGNRVPPFGVSTNINFYNYRVRVLSGKEQFFLAVFVRYFAVHYLIETPKGEGSKQLRFVRPDRGLERRGDHQNELESGDSQRRGLPDYRMHLSSHRCLEIRLLRKKQNGRLNYRK